MRFWPAVGVTEKDISPERVSIRYQSTPVPLWIVVPEPVIGVAVSSVSLPSEGISSGRSTSSE
ncbi:hypothetical protein [Salipiger bermudensis]|uniref:hypothetical protein n=1 Tax=Salipiger bermudensis TaxID=344736 RepID=UPI001186C8CF|nr:hypothetical protein [Salipiger bermudensis]